MSLNVNKFDLEFQTTKKNNYYLFLVTITVNIATFVSGIAIGWPSSGIPRLNGKLDPESNPLLTPITAVEESWVGSLSPLLACVGPIIFGLASDKLGRKKTIFFTMVPLVIAFLIKMFANDVIYFLLARVLIGLGSGGVFTVIPIFIGEISEISNRGALGCILPVCCGSGILFSYIVGTYMTIKWFSLVAMIPSIAFFIMMIILVPESPHYLMMKNCEDLALKSLKRLRTDSVHIINGELKGIKEFVNDSFLNKLEITDIMKSKGLKKAFIINITLMVIQQGSGITVIFTYLLTIFESTGTNIPSDICTIVIGVIQLLACAITPFVIDKFGRRILLIISSIFCTISLSILATYLLIHSYGYDTSVFAWLPISTLIMYVIAHSVGFGPLPWVILSEIFPPNAKSLASIIVTICSSFLAFLTAYAYHYVVAGMGISQPFWLFATCSVCGGIFIYFCLPETKERSLRDIQIILNS